MSIVYRTRRPFPGPIVEQPASAASTPYRPRHAEAPDAGYRSCEAPESRASRHAEASDAGEGRGSLMETQFTHGRSRS